MTEHSLLRRALYAVMIISAAMWAVGLSASGNSRAPEEVMKVEAVKTCYFLAFVVSLAGLAAASRPGPVNGGEPSTSRRHTR
jgi:hypothetical protein